MEDLPATWNAKMQEYLGVVPPSDKEGVLQDVHWFRPTGTMHAQYTSNLCKPLVICSHFLALLTCDDMSRSGRSMGAVGYFPSYTLGAMMAAQVHMPTSMHRSRWM